MSVAIWLAVAVIGGTGSTLRFLVDRAVARRAGAGLPLGTLAVNVSGAVVLGFVTGLTLSSQQALLAGTALVGSYTTFSTWMLETQRLAEERQVLAGVGNVVVSVVLGVAAAALGRMVGAGL
jgi:fluoride exporter